MLNFNEFVLMLFVIFIIFCIIILTIFYFIYKSTLKSNDYQKNQNWNENIDKEKQKFYKDETDALNNWLSNLDKKSFKAVIVLVLIHYFREDIKHIKNRIETKKGKSS